MPSPTTRPPRPLSKYHLKKHFCVTPSSCLLGWWWWGGGRFVWGGGRVQHQQHHHNTDVRAGRRKRRGVACVPGSSSSSHQPPPTPNFLRGCFCAKAEASSFFLFFIVFSSSNFRKCTTLFVRWPNCKCPKNWYCWLSQWFFLLYVHKDKKKNCNGFHLDLGDTEMDLLIKVNVTYFGPFVRVIQDSVYVAIYLWIVSNVGKKMKKKIHRQLIPCVCFQP